MALYRVYGEETVSIVTTIEASSPEEAEDIAYDGSEGKEWSYVEPNPTGNMISIVRVEEI